MCCRRPGHPQWRPYPRSRRPGRSVARRPLRHALPAARGRSTRCRPRSREAGRAPAMARRSSWTAGFPRLPSCDRIGPTSISRAGTRREAGPRRGESACPGTTPIGSRHVGERWRVVAKLRCPRGFANPGAPDRELALLREGIGATGYVVNGGSPERLDGPVGARHRAAAGTSCRRDCRSAAPGTDRRSAAGPFRRRTRQHPGSDSGKHSRSPDLRTWSRSRAFT